jgi:hypothetical protein
MLALAYDAALVCGPFAATLEEVANMFVESRDRGGNIEWRERGCVRVDGRRVREGFSELCGGTNQDDQVTCGKEPSEIHLVIVDVLAVSPLTRHDDRTLALVDEPE